MNASFDTVAISGYRGNQSHAGKRGSLARDRRPAQPKEPACYHASRDGGKRSSRITLKLMDDPLGGGGYYIAAILSDRNMNIYHRFGWANLDIAIGQAIINLSGSAMQRRPTKSRKGAKHGNA